ncbi:MAG: hypothetical protein D6706_22220 [Chloroflexi bacterium]|nr:MAG: hypothetical protein D6706_22220 [Chloroflexota bacterium]
MRKYVTQKLGWVIFLLLPLLAACGGTVETAVPATPAQQEAIPAQQEPETATEAEPPTAVESTSEEEVLPVAGKPQLIEFYADW